MESTGRLLRSICLLLLPLAATAQRYVFKYYANEQGLALPSQLSGVFRRSWRVGVNKALAINKHFQMCL